MKLILAIVVFTAVFAACSCDCGCLQCSKHLHVVSPPAAPVKIIYRGTSCDCPRQIPYTIEEPVIKTETPKLRNYCYQCQAVQIAKPKPKLTPLCTYNYQVQVPVVQKKPCTQLYGLVAAPDRVVMPAKGCVVPKPTCTGPGPIFETLKDVEDEDYSYGPYVDYVPSGCPCRRYARKKRSLLDDNVERNIRDIFYNPWLKFFRAPDETPAANLRRVLEDGDISTSNIIKKLGALAEKKLDLIKKKKEPEFYRVPETNPYPSFNLEDLDFDLKSPKFDILEEIGDLDLFKKKSYPEFYRVPQEPLFKLPSLEFRFARGKRDLKPKNTNDKEGKNVFGRIKKKLNLKPQQHRHFQQLRHFKTRSRNFEPLSTRRHGKSFKATESGGAPEALTLSQKMRKNKILRPKRNTAEIHTTFSGATSQNSNLNPKDIEDSHVKRDLKHQIRSPVNLGDIPLGKPRLSNRQKRDYYQITDIEDNDLSELPLKNPSESFYEPFDIEEIFPQIPLFFFINAPVRMLKHFDKLKNHFEPIVECVPKVLETSKRYLSSFGGKIKRSVLGLANRFLGSFDRSKRSLQEDFEVLDVKNNSDGTADVLLLNKRSKIGGDKADLALVFQVVNCTDIKVYCVKISERGLTRKKRSLLKLVDHSEIRDLLKAKFSEEDIKEVSGEDIFEKHFNSIPKLRDAFKPKKKVKVVLEQFDTSTLLKPKTEESRSFPELADAASFFKSNNIFKNSEIVGAKNFQETTHHFDPEKNLQVIKNEITKILTEIQSLIHSDIEPETKIYSNLSKLQFLKQTLCSDWRRSLEDTKPFLTNNILNYIKELDKLLVATVKSLTAQLTKDNFNKRNQVKTLVQLYKLRTIFERISEDLSEKLRMGVKVSAQEQRAYINHLSKINITSLVKPQIEQELKLIKDKKIEILMKRLEKFRQLLENEVDEDTTEEINSVSRLIQESSHLKKLQQQAVKDLNVKVKLGKNFRKDLKTVSDFEFELEGIEEELGRVGVEEEEEVEEEEVVGTKKEGLKEKVEEFLKNFEEKRTAWLEKNKLSLRMKSKH